MTYHLAGDSTVAACPPSEHPMSGWGAVLGEVVDRPVRNLAVGGGTTESCLQEYWDELLAGIAPGDTVILQFGHNDQKQPELLAARGGYTERLRRMAADARARGAGVVLCTSVERRRFVGDRIAPTHGDYPDAVRDLAHEIDAPLIDLQAFTAWLYEDLGPEGSMGLLSHYPVGMHPTWPEGLHDDTHFQLRGARKVAAFVARSLRGIERADGGIPAAPPAASVEPGPSAPEETR
ncbi:GDSL-type esterase/lipase family protein [Brachybacterium sp. DNPG3]